MAFTTINNGSLFMNTKLYTGNGANNHAITGVGFQPDLVWCKNRTSAQANALVNSVTGRNALISNASDAEYVMNAGQDFGTFDSDGFTVLVPNQLNSFNFNGSIDAGSNYNVAKTTTYFSAYLNENDSSGTLEYSTSQDLAQATGFQKLAGTVSVDNDHALSGYLHLFNPSSTTFVKHFIWSCNYGYETGTENTHGAGYFNTTSDIDAVRFQMTSDAIDAGDICLYGIA